MTIRVGANPVGQLYVGPQAGSTLNNRIASGALSFQLSIASSSIATRRLFGSGDIDLPGGMTFEAISVLPAIRRGTGDVSIGALGQSGTGGKTAHPFGQGNLPLGLSLLGAARRRALGSGDIGLTLRFNGFAENNGGRIAIGELTLGSLDLAGDAVLIQHIPASGDVPLGLSIAGLGIVKLHVVASGDLSLGLLSVHDIAVGTTIQIKAIDGILMDPVLEGTFIELITLEGSTG